MVKDDMELGSVGPALRGTCVAQGHPLVVRFTDLGTNEYIEECLCRKEIRRTNRYELPLDAQRGPSLDGSSPSAPDPETPDPDTETAPHPNASA